MTRSYTPSLRVWYWGTLHGKQKNSYAHARPIHGDDYLREERLNLHTFVDR